MLFEVAQKCVPANLRTADKKLQFEMLDDDGEFTDPLKWWKENQNKYPTAAGVAKEYLATPATSAPLERIWSCAARVLTANELVLRMSWYHV